MTWYVLVKRHLTRKFLSLSDIFWMKVWISTYFGWKYESQHISTKMIFLWACLSTRVPMWLVETKLSNSSLPSSLQVFCTSMILVWLGKPFSQKPPVCFKKVRALFPKHNQGSNSFRSLWRELIQLKQLWWHSFVKKGKASTRGQSQKRGYLE